MSERIDRLYVYQCTWLQKCREISVGIGINGDDHDDFEIKVFYIEFELLDIGIDIYWHLSTIMVIAAVNEHGYVF